MLNWLKKNWPRIIALIIILALLAFVGLLIYSRLTLGFWPDWTGFGDFTYFNGEFQRGKTLWDWLQLLIIPFVLLGGAAWLERSERKSDRLLAEVRRESDLEIARENRQEAELDNFIQAMTELLLDKKLKTEPTDEVRDVARIRTLATLRRLDAQRKTLAMHFLIEAGLVQSGVPDHPGDPEKPHLVSLAGADLRGANLWRADLRGADLRGANLEGAILEVVVLEKANLMGADLGGANLKGANLREANLQGATMHDGTKYSESTDLTKFTGVVKSPK